MKKIRIFFRSIRDGFKSVGRNFSLSLASILCITITLVIVSVALIISANLNYATKTIENELSIVLYTKSDVDANKFKEVLDSINHIGNYDYISKEESKVNLSQYSSSFERILNYLDNNPLLDSFVIYVDDVKNLNDIAESLEKLEEVESVKYGEGMIDEIIKAFDIVEKFTIGTVIALILVTIFLVTNTIKLTIYSRKNEIEIMRLVGASNSAIKLPFFVEGLIIGIIGSIIPICVSIYGYVILYNTLNGFLFTEMLSLVKPMPFTINISVLLLIIGAVVGSYGSAKATRKYLKI